MFLINALKFTIKYILLVIIYIFCYVFLYTSGFLPWFILFVCVYPFYSFYKKAFGSQKIMFINKILFYIVSVPLVFMFYNFLSFAVLMLMNLISYYFGLCTICSFSLGDLIGSRAICGTGAKESLCYLSRAVGSYIGGSGEILRANLETKREIYRVLVLLNKTNSAAMASPLSSLENVDLTQPNNSVKSFILNLSEFKGNLDKFKHTKTLGDILLNSDSGVSFPANEPRTLNTQIVSSLKAMDCVYNFNKLLK